MSNKPIKTVLLLKDKIYRFALHMLGNRDDALDVVQDIQEKVLTEKIKANTYQNVESVIIKATKNLCLDRLKHQTLKREKLNEMGILHTSVFNETNTDEMDLTHISKHLIKQLPQKQKVVIHLRDIEGYEFDEIAKITELDINAVRMNLSRARKTIREQLLKMMNYGL